jgi:hypothetical protein
MEISFSQIAKFSKEKKRKSWSGDGDDNTPWHTVLGQQINHVIFLWMAGSMFVAAAVLLAPIFAQRCNVIHTLQQDMHTLLYTSISLNCDYTTTRQWTHFYTSISLNCHYSGNDETIMFHMITTTTHLHCCITRDAHPMRGEVVTHIPLHACYQWKLIIYII